MSNKKVIDVKQKSPLRFVVWAVVLIYAAIILFSMCTFNVQPNEYAAVKQFGEVVSIKETPGLYFKLPFVQDIQFIDQKIHVYDIPASDVITKDKKSMIADNYIFWKVVDADKYIKTLNATDARAQERVEAAVYNATKNIISAMTQEELIAFRGEKLTAMLIEEANSDIGQYGIQIVLSEIKSLGLPEDNKQAVCQRMVSERKNIAAGYEAKGAAEAQKIRNETDKNIAIIEAEAQKEAEKLRAEGEAEYMKILSKAYNDQDKASFYEFIRSLDALKTSLVSGDKTIILDKDSELVKLLYGLGLE